MRDLCLGIQLKPLPAPQKRSPDVPHAPMRNVPLTKDETKVSVNDHSFARVTNTLQSGLDRMDRALLLTELTNQYRERDP